MIRGMIVLGLGLALAGCGAAADGLERQVRLPAVFPQDVPLPESAVLKTAQDLGQKGLNLVLETDEGVPTAAGRYGDRLRAAGWRLVAEAAVEGADFLSYRKGERSVAVAVTRFGKQTLLGISLVERWY